MKIKKGFVLREMCGENIVTAEGLEHINFNKLISLNSTAAFLWNKVEIGRASCRERVFTAV